MLQETVDKLRTERKVGAVFDNGVLLRDGTRVMVGDKVTRQTEDEITWAEGLDTKEAHGYFSEQPFPLVLDAIGRRVGAQVNDLDGVYYVGELGPDDLASAVISMPAGEPSQIEARVRQVISAKGRVAVLGGTLWSKTQRKRSVRH